MSSDYSALCSDHYVNTRLNLKMDLSLRRDTVLSLFDRVRRERPAMDHLKRYKDELALESRDSTLPNAYQWMAVRRTSVRTGSVNHPSDSDMHSLHRTVLRAAPNYLDITALDVDTVEVLFGFDLVAGGNHDAIVFNALLAGSPMAALCERPRGGDGIGFVRPVDCQPVFGVALNEAGDLSAHFEVKTRSGTRHARGGAGHEVPISIYLTVRKQGPFGDVDELPDVYDRLAVRGEELLEQRIVPNLILPIREAIGSA